MSVARATIRIATELPCQRVTTNDIDPTQPSLCHADAAGVTFWQTVVETRGPIDWVVTNPPFAQPTNYHIVRHALAHARCGVAMIQRLSFLEPTQDRSDFLVEHPPTRMIVMPRWSYTSNGKTDSVTTAWMIWLRNEAWQRWALDVPPIVIAPNALRRSA